MKRVIKFDGGEDSKGKFGLLYHAMITARVDIRNMEVLRKESRLMTALEAVSVPTTQAERDGKDLASLRKIEGPCEVVLEQPDFELMVSYLERAHWSVFAAPRVVALADYLSACKEYVPPPPEPSPAFPVEAPA
jgi:hypothetical protein